MKKRITVLILSVVFLLSFGILAGCNSKGDDTGEKQKVTAISITGAPTTALVVGESVQLGYTSTPKDNVEEVSVKFISDKSFIASVTEDGLVTPKMAGSTVITAQVTTAGYNNIKSTVTITVENETFNITAISITGKPENNKMQVGDAEIKLGYLTTPDTSVKPFTYNFSSSNPAVATVGERGGELNAVGEGTAEITIQVTGEGNSAIKDSFTLNVTDPTKGTLNDIKLDLLGGAKQDGNNIKIDIPAQANDWGNSASIVADSQDFTITAKVNFKPGSNSLQAGIMVHEAGYKAIKISRIFTGGNRGIQFDECTGGVMTGGKLVEDYMTATAIYLRVIKDGNQIAGYYSPDNVSYRLISIGTTEIQVANIRLFASSWTAATGSAVFESLSVDYNNHTVINPNLVTMGGKSLESVGNVSFTEGVATVVTGGQSNSTDENAGLTREITGKTFSITFKLNVGVLTENQRAGLTVRVPGENNNYLRLHKQSNKIIAANEGTGLLATGNQSQIPITNLNDSIYFKVVRDNAKLFFFAGNSLTDLKSVGVGLTLNAASASANKLIVMLSAADYGQGSITAEFSDYTEASTANYELAEVLLTLTESYKLGKVSDATVSIKQSGADVTVTNVGDGVYKFSIKRGLASSYSITHDGMKVESGGFLQSNMDQSTVNVEIVLTVITTLTLDISSDTNSNLTNTDVQVEQAGGYVSDIKIVEGKYIVDVKRGMEYTVTIAADGHDAFVKSDYGAPSAAAVTHDIVLEKSGVVKYIVATVTVKNNKTTADLLTNAIVVFTQGDKDITATHTSGGVYTAKLVRSTATTLKITAPGHIQAEAVLTAASLAGSEFSKEMILVCSTSINVTYKMPNGDAVDGVSVVAKQTFVATDETVTVTELSVTTKSNGLYEIIAIANGGKVEIIATKSKMSKSVISISAQEVAYVPINKNITLYSTAINNWLKDDIAAGTDHTVDSVNEKWSVNKVVANGNNWTTSIGKVVNGNDWEVSMKVENKFTMQHQLAGFMIGGLGDKKYHANTFAYTSEFDATNGHIGTWLAKGTANEVFNASGNAVGMTEPLSSVYLKIQRKDGDIKLYYSKDGTSYTKIGDLTLKTDFASNDIVIYMSAWAYQDSATAPFFGTTFSEYNEVHYN